MVNGRDWKVWQFSSNGFWENIGCPISAPTVGLGVSRMLEKEEAQKISGKKRKIITISIKVDLKVYTSCTIYCLIFYFMSILTPFFARFVASLTTGERNSGSIDHNNSSRKRTRIHMNGGGQSY